MSRKLRKLTDAECQVLAKRLYDLACEIMEKSKDESNARRKVFDRSCQLIAGAAVRLEEIAIH